MEGPLSTQDAHLLSCVFQQHQLGVEVRGAQAGWRLAAPRVSKSRSHDGCKGRGASQGPKCRGEDKMATACLPGAFSPLWVGATATNLLGTSTQWPKSHPSGATYHLGQRLPGPGPW